MDIPAYPTDIGRVRVVNNIARKATTATLLIADDEGGEPTELTISARLALPSASRKVELAGMHNITDSLEAMVAMPSGARKPEPERDQLEVDGVLYDVRDVQLLDGDDCYNLTLARA